MANKCKNECERDSGSICLNQSDKGYGCTRLYGHTGQHVACGTSEHDLYVWENENGTN